MARICVEFPDNLQKLMDDCPENKIVIFDILPYLTEDSIIALDSPNMQSCLGGKKRLVQSRDGSTGINPRMYGGNIDDIYRDILNSKYFQDALINCLSSDRPEIQVVFEGYKN